MKRLELDRARWLEVKQQRLARKLRRISALQQHQKLLRRNNAKRWETSIVRVPAVVLAERAEDRAKLSACIRAAATALKRSRTRVKFDFTKTTRLYPGGTLILMSHLEQFLRQYPSRVSACCTPKSLAAQLLRHFGIADALKVSAAMSQPTNPLVLNWRYITGNDADGSQVLDLIEDYRNLTSAEIPDGLYDVLTEALTNVSNHAYPVGIKMPEWLKRWWIFARYDEPCNGEVGNLYVAVYDRGAGIPGTLRSQLKLGEKVAALADAVKAFIGFDDEKRWTPQLLLRSAVEHKRTQTDLAHRGNGLPEMLNFVQENKSGVLSIISGGAQYTCLPAKGYSGAVPCATDFFGTLILWSLPLQPKEIST